MREQKGISASESKTVIALGGVVPLAMYSRCLAENLAVARYLCRKGKEDLGGAVAGCGRLLTQVSSGGYVPSEYCTKAKACVICGAIAQAKRADAHIDGWKSVWQTEAASRDNWNVSDLCMHKLLLTTRATCNSAYATRTVKFLENFCKLIRSNLTAFSTEASLGGGDSSIDRPAFLGGIHLKPAKNCDGWEYAPHLHIAIVARRRLKLGLFCKKVSREYRSYMRSLNQGYPAGVFVGRFEPPLVYHMDGAGGTFGGQFEHFEKYVHYICSGAIGTRRFFNSPTQADFSHHSGVPFRNIKVLYDAGVKSPILRNRNGKRTDHLPCRPPIPLESHDRVNVVKPIFINRRVVVRRFEECEGFAEARASLKASLEKALWSSG